MRVLLVEDNGDFALPCRQLLAALRGVQVVQTAASAQEACDWLRANPGGWDLVVVDLFLGQGHGFTVLRECAGRPPLQRAVVLSAYADETARQYARKAGADAFFSKTNEMDALLAYCLQLAGEVDGANR
ncbi:response regulator [Caenimonas terrae]|uniref:Response regulator n=1 Tax=Caenimonas terrae TaxID=696074 RepID=A0ABW0NH46_9BURK